MTGQRAAGAWEPGSGRAAARPLAAALLTGCAAAAAAAPAAAAAAAQVSISPSTTSPAAWERFAVRVAGAGDTAVTGVRVEIPLAITVMGVEPLLGWESAFQPATDTTPQAVSWKGGPLRGFEFREFAFLGRVAGDARRHDLVFPVRVTLADGATLHFAGSPGALRPAPRVQIVGRTQLSARGAVAMTGIAIAIALVALGVALTAAAAGRAPPNA